MIGPRAADHRLVPLLARKPLATLATAAVATAAAGVAVAPAAHADAPKNADVLLELRHGGGLHDFVRAVSDPASPRYRQYRSVEQLARRFGASPTTKRTTTKLLREHGLTAEVGPTGTYVLARGPVGAVADLFGGAAGRAAGSADGGPANVPAELDGAVASAAIVAGDSLAQRRATASDATTATPRQAPATASSARPRTGTPSGCAAGQAAGEGQDVGFTPNQYLTAYGHAALHARNLPGQSMRVAVVEIDGFNPSDVAAFAACFGLDQPKINAHAVGIEQLLPAGPETTLDLQVLTAGAPGLKAIDVYEGRASNAGVLRSTAAALGTPKTRPDVISISVGGCEAESYAQVAQMRAQNELYALAAGAGISVLAAAGDQGSTDCTTANGLALPLLSVDFPGSSPYVTSVGGTNLELDARNRIVDEITWNDAPLAFGATGGGISILHDRPWYQTRAGQPKNTSNDVMRLVPDVAALADEAPGYAIYCTADTDLCRNPRIPQGGWVNVGGTSAATPLTASLVVLADQAARKAGQPNLGTINPLVYAIGTSKAYGKVFRDVTTGSNDLGALIPTEAFGGTPGPMGCCPAEKGYDFVSGWGSPKGPAFVRAALRAGRR